MGDVNYAIHTLWKRPGFTVVAVVTLALGIGANTAVFSVINAVLLAPLPYEEPERLVAVWNRQPTANLTQQPIALADLKDWQENNQAFEQLAASRGVTFNLTRAGPQEQPRPLDRGPREIALRPGRLHHRPEMA